MVIYGQSHLIITEEDYYTIDTSINLTKYLDTCDVIISSLKSIQSHDYYEYIDNESRRLIRKYIHERIQSVKTTIYEIGFPNEMLQEHLKNVQWIQNNHPYYKAENFDKSIIITPEQTRLISSTSASTPIKTNHILKNIIKHSDAIHNFHDEDYYEEEEKPKRFLVPSGDQIKEQKEKKNTENNTTLH